MTLGEWNDMVTVLHGSFEAALERVKQTLLAKAPEQGFAVHVDHALDPSTSADRAPWVGCGRRSVCAGQHPDRGSRQRRFPAAHDEFPRAGTSGSADDRTASSGVTRPP